MNTQDYARLKDILGQCLEMERAKRHRYLEELRVKEPDIYAEVIELLALDGEEEDDFLESPPPMLQKPLEDPMIGTQIGAYKILSHIASGGMGKVYLAEREDQEFKRKVAIKVLKKGMDSDEVVARFRNERQILANLAHPNIARLLSGGSTDNHQPYLVMEYIEGEDILTWCEKHNPSVKVRLNLFLKVCDAVSSAHQKLVVHRDLKPGNILVTKDGEPKLLDFGIAKLLDEGHENNLTRTNVRLLTPEYASPEQLRGEPITTATDIYALGTLLYILLTGINPNAGRAPSGDSPHRVLSPSQAMRRAGTTELRLAPKKLSRDLEVILLKSLREEANRRYPSADELAADIERFMNGHPVLARKGNFAYVTRKFVIRHRLAMSFLLLSFLGLSTSVAILLHQNEKLVAERNRVERQRQRMERVQQFLVRLFMKPNLTEQDRNPTTILFHAMEQLRQDHDNHPKVRAEIILALSSMYAQYGYSPQAEPLLMEALDTVVNEHGDHHEDAIQLRYYLGMLNQMNGGLERALSFYEEALENQIELKGEDSMIATRIYLAYSDIYLAKGKIDISQEYLQKSLEIGRRIGLGYLTQLALERQAAIFRRQSRYAEAEEKYREVIPMITEPRHKNKLANVILKLSLVVRFQARYDEAEEIVREAMAMMEELWGKDSKQYLRAASYLSRIYIETHRPELAIPLSESAMNACLDVSGSSSACMGESLVYTNSLISAHRFDMALAYIYCIRDELKDHTGMNASSLVNLHLQQVRCYFELGEYAKILELEKFTRSQIGDYGGKGNMKLFRGRALIALGFVEKGHKLIEETLNNYIKSYGEYHWVLATNYRDLSADLAKLGQTEASERYHALAELQWADLRRQREIDRKGHEEKSFPFLMQRNR